MFSFEIEPGLELRPLQETDASKIYEMIQSSREHLRTFLIFVDLTTKKTDTEKFVKETMITNVKGESFVTTIYKDGEFCGLVGYNTIDQTNKRAEVGYWLGEPFTGLGIMTKATRAIIAYGFNAYGINRIDLKAATANDKSRAVAHRLGFKEEGVIREAEWAHDRYLDHVHYGLLKRDWQQ